MSELGLELLAPAGDLDTLKAVIDAGADAVYFGGEMFGARAYAKNFSYEDAVCGIKYAKLHNRKAYLTVNTLIKNKEFDENLYSYLKDYYEAGIDAFLVQDYGLFRFIKEHFPDVEVHASTQVSTSSKYGAEYLKEQGADRVVLSRETSLDEIREIYKATKMDIEVFVHGAICVCYSGNCFMSSFLGGRSGNRGRCAQPCRLPYHTKIDGVDSAEVGDYLLSPADMCLLSHIPELSEAGAYSLKIEGRMKSPSYAAGVVSIYRKYIDLYLKTKKPYKVSKADMDFLKSLGQRGGFTDTYLKHQNGPSLMSMKDSSLHLDKKVTYAPEPASIPLSAEVYLTKNSESVLRLVGEQDEVTVLGDIVSEALKRPLSKEDVIKQIGKTGDSVFSFKNIEVYMEDDIFLPVSALNKLRREAFSKYEELLFSVNRSDAKKCTFKAKSSVKNEMPERISYSVFVTTREQLECALEYVSENDTLILSHSLLEEDIENISTDARLTLALPEVFRLKAERYFEENHFSDRVEMFDGFMASSYDGLGYLLEHGIEKERIIIDHRLYTFNNMSINEFREEGFEEFIAPIELNAKELKHRDNSDSACIVYGYLPLMISANCTRKNVHGCDKKPSVNYLKDRKNISFAVRNDCSICMNTIYNSLPLDLFSELGYLEEIGFNRFRIDFTVEQRKECLEVLSEYFEGVPVSREVTKGHFNRGVL